MVYLLGDVQGCDEALALLLAEIGFSPSRDRLVLLGDLVNRGPASAAVLRRVVALGAAAQSVLGNHDLHLLAVQAGARGVQRRDTFQDVLDAPDAAALLDWLRQQPLACSVEGWLCVHAGLVPQWSAADALAFSAEVQAVLRGARWLGFVPQMYGNKPARWREDLEGAARWRFIINAMTRLRFCAEDGTLDFDTKEAAGSAPAGFLPWFAVPGRRSAGSPIAIGHWSTLGLRNQPDLLALDTGCVWGGCLSAARVDGGRREVVSVACPQAQSPH